MSVQPLWALVPASARARYIRRAAVAMLDELDDLAEQLAGETGWARELVVESELLPAARGLHELADEGPGALADRRRRATRIVQAPVGAIALRGPSASPWAEPVLETAAALLAGNRVVLDVPAARLRSVFLRAGVPGELIESGKDVDGARVIDLPRPGGEGILLVLGGAPVDKVVEAARHPGRRVIAVPEIAGRLTAFGVTVEEAADTEAAIAMAAGDVPVSVW
ncbi:MAG TPA: aldehyde dehydrogenase family protein, partial [Solirubrobacter sp.]|nr:aldehyde dehydrogenase family protein [Solirubrobacter sp.]